MVQERAFSAKLSFGSQNTNDRTSRVAPRCPPLTHSVSFLLSFVNLAQLATASASATAAESLRVAVEGAPALLQSVHNVHSGDSFPLGVLGVCYSITDNVFQEYFQNTSGFLIDETGDSLHTTSASETTDGWLCDTLNVITQNLSVTFSASLSKTLSSFTSSGHDFNDSSLKM